MVLKEIDNILSGLKRYGIKVSIDEKEKGFLRFWETLEEVNAVCSHAFFNARSGRLTLSPNWLGLSDDAKDEIIGVCYKFGKARECWGYYAECPKEDYARLGKEVDLIRHAIAEYNKKFDKPVEDGDTVQ